ncbi:sigma 54-interacting transcriptional regulator [Halomonas sp. PAMB 3264]|uniref:sigma-54 interaction domain-containing protein n=1 Tax=Halomonas sp. PAMB 3264 TaxID=3075222 RepID=UPI00289B6315|nr:sigma 54-interacting transcriptional regulator [Halomonas sp. PAMB 3264]WNL42733.1 sigma 54-interacting transcriptional regulator [Halomonas sp. PAMB 3264]
MPKSLHKTLVSWIGGNDLKAVGHEPAGPIWSTLKNIQFDAVKLLYAYPYEQVAPYIALLECHTDIAIEACEVSLSSPVNFGEIYLAVEPCLARLASKGTEISILLSPGTPAMQAVWILLGKTKFSAVFYQSSLEKGVEKVRIPFELAAEFVPSISVISDNKFRALADSRVPINAAFDNIVTQNPSMLLLKQQAQMLAERHVPVLIYGETGTGKELFARAIHNASPRREKPFIALNCGAIPEELIDSTLFGHKKGAFTGAVADRSGVFQQADGGTLFLDEFGELSPQSQVRLLRVLQEGRLVPVGSDAEHPVDVRIITATHRNLMEAVAGGQFREDLFYRVAVGVLHLPPLRARQGDLSLLADVVLKAQGGQDSVFLGKKLSAEAKKVILQHSWRGNVRELQSTLVRAALWSSGESITGPEMRQALFIMPERGPGLLNHNVTQGIDLNVLMADLAAHYIRDAMAHTAQNKTKAAKLLGLKSQQTLSNWMMKYGIE